MLLNIEFELMEFIIELLVELTKLLETVLVGLKLADDSDWFIE